MTFSLFFLSLDPKMIIHRNDYVYVLADRQPLRGFVFDQQNDIPRGTVPVAFEPGPKAAAASFCNRVLLDAFDEANDDQPKVEALYSGRNVTPSGRLTVN